MHILQPNLKYEYRFTKGNEYINFKFLEPTVARQK